MFQLMYAILFCLTRFLLGLTWLHLLCYALQKSQHSHGWAPTNYWWSDNHNKGIVSSTKHPEMKWINTSYATCKGRDDIILVVFTTIFGSTSVTIWCQDGNCTFLHCHKTNCFNHGFSREKGGRRLFVTYNTKSF
jgi:hypothetical protein